MYVRIVSGALVLAYLAGCVRDRLRSLRHRTDRIIESHIAPLVERPECGAILQADLALLQLCVKMTRPLRD